MLRLSNEVVVNKICTRDLLISWHDFICAHIPPDALHIACVVCAIVVVGVNLVRKKRPDEGAPR
jgi:hypothetical protein